MRNGDDFRFASRPAPSHLVTLKGATLENGHRVSIAHGAAISAHLAIHIGDDARLGPFVVIMDSDFHVAGDCHALAEPSPVHIGKNVVIGGGVTILRGSVIGDGAQIESGSVVGGNIPAGARVGGFPAVCATTPRWARASTSPGWSCAYSVSRSFRSPVMGRKDPDNGIRWGN